MISGIIHVLRSGCRWRDVPAVYGPPKTIYNRWHRWSQRRFWQSLFEALREVSPDDAHCIDSTTQWPTALPPAEKGGVLPGYRPLARRSQHQDPPTDRRSRSADRVPAHPRPARRCARRNSAA
ncbi:transposase [Acuticoccus sp. I52.16.1]|uniref:transposase n=1 Tax=Acuticoccus sp. I52.16.1 TaxID=2928472 RepID=UPI00352DECA8